MQSNEPLAATVTIAQLAPAQAALLRTLHQEHTAGKAVCSLAKLCKRLDLRMSTLQRELTSLDDAGLVVACANPGGAPAVAITASGLWLAALLRQPQGQTGVRPVCDNDILLAGD